MESTSSSKCLSHDSDSPVLIHSFLCRVPRGRRFSVQTVRRFQAVAVASKMILVLASLLALLNNIHGFSVGPRYRHIPVSQRFMSEPSDTSSDSDDVLTIDSEPYIPTESEALVTSVLDKLSGLSADVSTEARSAINEALLRLESMNPTENPTMSPMLNGVWELRYAAGYASDWALQSPTR